METLHIPFSNDRFCALIKNRESLTTLGGELGASITAVIVFENPQTR